MTSQLGSAVVYDGLPISSGGAHAINRLSHRAAMGAWRAFLDACADQVQVDGVLRVDEGPGPSASPETLRLVDVTFPAKEASRPFLRMVPEDRVDDGVALMEQICPQPADRWGNAAVSLIVEAQFLIRTPRGVGLWPGQDRDLFGRFRTPGGLELGVSSCRLCLIGNHRAMGLSLTLPLATDSDLGVVRPWLQEHLPFRLSARHWTRWTLNKNGVTYRGRRVH